MLRQTTKITSLLSLCQRHHDAIGYTLRVAETPRLEPRAASSLTSFFSTKTNSSTLSGTAHSLEYPRQPAPPEASNGGLFRSIMLKIGGYYSKESTLMRAADGLYDSVTETATNPAFLDAFQIPRDFQHQHAVLCLHVWLILVRLRPEGTDGKALAQIFYDNFQDDLEMRVRKAGVKVKVRQQLGELEKQFYGTSMAYDKALKGESAETLEEALLRNIYQGEKAKEASAGKLERSTKATAAESSSGNTSTAALVTVAIGLAGFFWWRSHRNKSEKNSKGSRSSFKFPAGKAAKAGPAPTTTAAASTSSLPRNKTSNNKKNKARRKEEKQKKAVQQDKAAPAAAKASSGGADQGQPSTAVINYTYFDTARRDTILGPIHKKPTLSAADVMKKDKEKP